MSLPSEWDTMLELARSILAAEAEVDRLRSEFSRELDRIRFGDLSPCGKVLAFLARDAYSLYMPIGIAQATGFAIEDVRKALSTLCRRGEARRVGTMYRISVRGVRLATVRSAADPIIPRAMAI